MVMGQKGGNEITKWGILREWNQTKIRVKERERNPFL